MTEATPRRFEGTLLERAAALYELAPRPPELDGAHRSGGVTFAPPPPVFPTDDTPRAASTVAYSGPRRSAAIERDLLKAQGMLIPGGRVTALAEEFRQVKRQLLSAGRSAGDGGTARGVLICSAKPGEGKTFCAVNLALSLAAEKDLEVLLVDADFSKPDILARLGVEVDGPGLLDAIADPALPVESLVVDTDVPQLKLLPAGTRSDSDTELLSSAHARTVIAALSAAKPNRIVLFDSSPALAASPSPVLAGYVGQVVLIVRADKTNETDLRDAVGLLDACENIQLLLNAVAYQPGGRRFSYYGQEPEE